MLITQGYTRTSGLVLTRGFGNYVYTIPSYVLDPALADTATRELRDSYAQAMSNRNLLTLLGDFWSEYFRDWEVVKQTMSGVGTLFSTEYSRLLEMVLSSNIIDISVHYPVKYDLLVFSSAEAECVRNVYGGIEYVKYPANGMEGIRYLLSSLFEPNVVLEEGTHFTFHGDHIRFLVDLFNDQAITDYVPTLSDRPRYIMLWGCNVCLQESYIYERFGRHLYTSENNSLVYKSILGALLRFYVTTKSPKNIENILNIMYGLPYSRTPGETVQSVEIIDYVTGEVQEEGIDYEANALADVPGQMLTASLCHRVTTDRNVYLPPIASTVNVSVGQRLTQFDLIASFVRVEDYITDPDWYRDILFPVELIGVYRHPDFLAEHPDYAEYLNSLAHRYDGMLLHNGVGHYVGPYGQQAFTYNGEILHDGQYVYYYGRPPWDGTTPLVGLRARSADAGGNTYEQDLYDLMDRVLKYNLIYVNAGLTYENYSQFAGKVVDIYNTIRGGLPVYIYPVVNLHLKSILADEATLAFGEADEVSLLMNFGRDERIDDQVYYDGQHTHAPTFDSLYDGVSHHDGLIDYSSIASIVYGGSSDPASIIIRNLLGEIVETDNF